MHFVYILQCGDGSFYTGMTNNIERRLLEHQRGRGSKYVRSRLPCSLIYFEQCENRLEAYRRERQIKKMPKKAKVYLVSS